MRLATIIAAIAGLAIGVLVIAHFDFGAVLGAQSRPGAGMATGAPRLSAPLAMRAAE